MCLYHFSRLYLRHRRKIIADLSNYWGGLCHVATELLMTTGKSTFATILGFADLALVLVLISFLNAGTNILLITVLKA